ncbi:tRNA pseudouridine synthase C [Halorhodospira halophila SL1]|uniref:tRNA pseudouridine synthase C n=2 Tax=Halorhodospira halophila TaxID=1053 RepID=A1WTN6_HALHL|nr:pseudouridine synthase [Halorhodospira halophila]ABM61048.1 tRNA pseudouridine synthase C [Halorhodospira halophila SL1]
METADQDDRSLAILYRDERLIAVYKPAGLLVHRSNIDRDRDVVLQRLRDQLGGHWVYPVHRLDRATAGVLVFGLDPDAASVLAAAFREQRIGKRYQAVVRGWVEAPGRIDRPLGAGRRGEGGAPQPAVTDYVPLAWTELPIPVSRYDTARFTRLALHPQTGRQHQLRRHMKAISHPILGDTTHGDGANNRFFREHFGARRLLLVATELVVPHPADGGAVRLATEPDAELQAIFRRAGLGEAPSPADEAG